MTKYVWMMGLATAVAVALVVSSCGSEVTDNIASVGSPPDPSGPVEDSQDPGGQTCDEVRSCGECTMYVSKDREWAIIDCGNDGTRKIRLHGTKEDDDSKSEE